MRFYIRTLIISTIFVVLSSIARCQLYAGGGFGTFNIPAAQLKGYGPTLRIEFVPENKRGLAYWDASYFSKAVPAGTTDIYDNNGVPLGSVATTRRYTYMYNQIGFKALLGGDADERKVIPYIGGGVALVVATTISSYTSSYNLSDDVSRRFLYGFHANAGIQYNIKPVILELRGNLDLIIKPLVDDVSNVLTNFRLTATIPITR